MIERTTRYYRLDELDGEARERAYETWRDYWTPRADSYFGGAVEEDLGSLKAALASVRCKLADWEVEYSGWGKATCRVEMDDGFAWEIDNYHDDGTPLVDGLPEAKSDGCWIGVGFAERWNGECRPKLEGLLAEFADALAAAGGIKGREEASEVKGGALYEAYVNMAQEQADKCMAEIQADVEYRWTEEAFLADDEANGWYYEEDGTFAGHV